MSEHTVSGVGGETVVQCSNGKLYGPSDDAIDVYAYCPYCGAETSSDSHTVDTNISEVFCDETSMSTYRYCPKCGDNINE